MIFIVFQFALSVSMGCNGTQTGSLFTTVVPDAMLDATLGVMPFFTCCDYKAYFLARISKVARCGMTIAFFKTRLIKIFPVWP